MTKIIFVRHGESQANVLGVFGGMTNRPLSEIGLKQAERTAAYFQDKQVDVIYSSPLDRAYVTAETINRYHNKPLIAEYDLHEIYGGKWEEMPYTQLPVQYPEVYKKWKADFFSSCPPFGEPIPHVRERMRRVLHEIAEKHDGQTVLVASHAGPILVFCADVMGCDGKNVPMLDWCGNAALAFLEYENGVFTLKQYDYRGHLGDLETALPAEI